MTQFLHINSISEVHNFFGLEPPAHPLITVFRQWPDIEYDFGQVKMSSNFYLITMKGKIEGNSFKYGRNTYDFQEGTLVFMAPHQVMSFEDPIEELDDSGWTILFHPDLLRKTSLAEEIKQYNFFDYNVHEALHVSDKEKEFLKRLIEKIELEIHNNFDKHSQDLIIHNLESILKYSTRYFDRQFYTRTNFHEDIVSQFEEFLNHYFSSEALSRNGIPTVSFCGQSLNMSGAYLSDLLRVETGKSALDHIHFHVIEKAKNILLGTDLSVSQIAYDLGFTYPQHFSKLFKAKVGYSPTSYRRVS